MIDLRAEWESVIRNVPPLYDVYPDYFAPVCVQGDDGRKMKVARLGAAVAHGPAIAAWLRLSDSADDCSG